MAAEPQRLPGELDLGGAGSVLVTGRLPVTDGRREHAGHRGPALDLLGEPALGAVSRDAREHFPDRAHQHVGLTESWQDLTDIAKERSAGTDDQHAALGQAAVRVEQVGRAVQGDGGLPGAGAALDDQDAGVRRASDRVLLGLQRADDVTHPAGSRGFERS
jgi:hypothetical protein